mgnify:FL=1
MLFRSKTGRVPPWRVPAFLEALVDRETVDGLEWDVAQDVRAIEVSPQRMGVEAAVEGEASDWFDLRVRLRVGDHELSVGEALEALGSGQEYVEVGGVWVRLDGPRIRRLAALLEEARALAGWQGEGLRLSGMQVGVLDVLESQVDAVSVSQAWRDRVAALRGDDRENGLAPVASLAKLNRSKSVV